MTHERIDIILMDKFSNKDIPANIYNVFECGYNFGRGEMLSNLECLYNKLSVGGGNSYFELDGKVVLETDTAYALEGIALVIRLLKGEEV